LFGFTVQYTSILLEMLNGKKDKCLLISNGLNRLSILCGDIFLDFSGLLPSSFACNSSLLPAFAACGTSQDREQPCQIHQEKSAF